MECLLIILAISPCVLVFPLLQDLKIAFWFARFRLTIPSYGTSFLDFWRKSDFPLFKTVASLLSVGTSTMQGLHEATEKKYLITAGYKLIGKKSSQYLGNGPLPSVILLPC